MKLTRYKYYVLILFLLFFYLLLKKIVALSVVESQKNSLKGNIYNIFLSTYMNKLGGESVSKLFYFNPQITSPKRADIILNFSNRDISYNDSIINLIKSTNKIVVTDELKKWRKANIIFNNENIDISYKFHASSVDQYVNGAQSYSIKSKKPILGNKEFKLISNIDANYKNIFLNYMASMYKLIHEDVGKIIIVKDHEKVMDYFKYEKFDKKFVNKNFNLDNVNIIRNLTFYEGYSSNLWHRSDLDDTPYNLDFDEIDSITYNRWERLLSLKFDDLNIDKKYIGRYFSLLYLFGHPHHITGNNDKWVFSDQGIYPVFRNEGNIVFLSKSREDFNNSIFNNFYESKTLKKYKKMLVDDDVFNNRNIYLQKIVNERELILKKFDSIFHYNQDIHKRFNDNYFFIKNNHNYLKEIIDDNISNIDSYLNSGYITIMYKNDFIYLKTSRNNKLKIKIDNIDYFYEPKNYFLKDGKIMFSLNEMIIPNKNKSNNLLIIDTVTNDTITNEKSKFHIININ